LFHTEIIQTFRKLARNVMFFVTGFAMLVAMQTRRVYRKLVRINDGRGWQVIWVEAPQVLPVEPVARAMHAKEDAMKKRFSLRGCLVGSLLIIVLLAAGGWWFMRSRYPSVGAPPSSPVQVFLLTPSSGDEVNAGDYVPVNLQAAAPEPIVSAELFVDGKSLGVVNDSPESASWSWQAWPTGVHTLYARATAADGQVGQSQTVIVNVLVGSGEMQVPAGPGQTLDQVGADFGVPPDQMADANPQINPTDHLKAGQPVQVPTGGGAGNGPGAGGGPAQPAGGNPGNGYVPILVHWQFTPTEPVDKSYCYTSSGDGNWDKMPKEPFQFFFGKGPTEYQAYAKILTPGETSIQIQCWGWLGGVLKYLGDGQTKVDPLKHPDNVMVTGAGFQLSGFPDFPPVQTLGGGLPTVPSPYALREPLNTADCAKHYGNLLAGFVCDGLLNAQVQQYLVLEWEWQPATCWPTVSKCWWVNDIKGYHVYEIDPATQAQKLLKDILDPNQKVAAVPLPWGYRCYAVEAFADDPDNPGQEVVSGQTAYCPGQPPQPQKTVLTPTKWVTTGGQWIQSGDCDTYGLADTYVVKNKNTGFGNQPGEVLVGSYIVDNNDADCFRQGDYSGAVEFGQPVLPDGAVVQKALLKFSPVFTEYKASGVATNYTLLCVSAVSKAKQDWTGLGSPIHFYNDDVLLSPAYKSPITSLSGWDKTPEVDVTSAVNNWIQHSDQNHGFILSPAEALYPATDGSGSCLSGIGNVQLEIYYFVP
jgi:LysM repeat protein